MALCATINCLGIQRTKITTKVFLLASQIRSTKVTHLQFISVSHDNNRVTGGEGFHSKWKPQNQPHSMQTAAVAAANAVLCTGPNPTDNYQQSASQGNGTISCLADAMFTLAQQMVLLNGNFSQYFADRDNGIRASPSALVRPSAHGNSNNGHAPESNLPAVPQESAVSCGKETASVKSAKLMNCGLCTCSNKICIVAELYELSLTNRPVVKNAPWTAKA